MSFKCSECGGIVQGKTTDLKTIIYQCEFCGRKRTIPLEETSDLPVMDMSDDANLKVLME